MTNPLRVRLAATIAEWRTRRHLDQPCVYDCPVCGVLDEVEAALRAAPAAEEEPRCVDHGVELICPICFGVTLQARPAAPEGK